MVGKFLHIYLHTSRSRLVMTIANHAAIANSEQAGPSHLSKNAAKSAGVPMFRQESVQAVGESLAFARAERPRSAGVNTA